MRSPLLFLAALLAAAALVQVSRCAGERAGRAEFQRAEPSRRVAVRTERDGTETATYTVMLADQAGAIVRLRADSSRLARRLADELSRAKHIRAATAFTTSTPCGDTITQAVTLREERAPGALGFLKPREVMIDVRQLTPGARTLDVQSFAVPAPPAAPVGGRRVRRRGRRAEPRTRADGRRGPQLQPV